MYDFPKNILHQRIHLCSHPQLFQTVALEGTSVHYTLHYLFIEGPPVFSPAISWQIWRRGQQILIGKTLNLLHRKGLGWGHFASLWTFFDLFFPFCVSSLYSTPSRLRSNSLTLIRTQRRPVGLPCLSLKWQTRNPFKMIKELCAMTSGI